MRDVRCLMANLKDIYNDPPPDYTPPDSTVVHAFTGFEKEDAPPAYR